MKTDDKWWRNPKVWKLRNDIKLICFANFLASFMFTFLMLVAAYLHDMPAIAVFMALSATHLLFGCVLLNHWNSYPFKYIDDYFITKHNKTEIKEVPYDSELLD